MVQSQLGSAEALVPEEGKIVGSLIVGLFFHSSESNVCIWKAQVPFYFLLVRDTQPGGVGGTFWSQWR